ncbi:MAG: sigma-70 family RNA polymerase sigma factor, partial [Undibacterium sp.]|nr:sigma-70 family RNA polymerase sigma factor [Opitutaceae bacterium]
MSDHDLLQRYARTGDQAAFTELVARHLNLVYSAARRQVSPSQLAEDVTQSVFLDLARRARDFPSGQPLAPWLHVVTRRTAIDALRRESRRHAREQTALEIAAMQTPDSSWSHVEPLLDEAVAALPDPDRTAIVLRFFENKNLREIGAALGTNEDAAQKRVSRALDQLRTLLTRRGLTLTAAGLATDLSAHAILTAPVPLAATISASVVATLPAAALPRAQILAMTTLQ